METRKGTTKARSKSSGRRSKAKRSAAQRRKDHDESRRQLYRNNAEYREKVKLASRETYRRSSPKGENVLALRVPLTEAPYKTVEHVDGGEPFEERSYSLNQTAAALGKSQLAFKRWVKDGIMPEPEYVDTSHRYRQYLLWEVEAAIKPLADHFDVFDYLHTSHEDAVSNIWNAVIKARLEHGGSHGSTKEK